MRYFFHVLEAGDRVEDEEGTVLPDPETAIAQAAAVARQLAQDGGAGCLVQLTDESGKEIARFRAEPKPSMA
jgi:hypothetical protein